MRQINLWSFTLVLFVLLAAACTAATKPSVKFTPISGQINAGQEISFQVTASDTGKGVTRVEFMVDNNSAGDAKIDPPQRSIALPFKWLALAGQHTVSARAFNPDNAPSDLDTMVVMATGAPAPAPTVAPTAGPTAAATAVLPTAQPGPGPCTNNAVFVADVTIPDGSQFQPNQQFTKTWRMQNTGTCAFTPNFQLAFVTGERMTNVTQVAVPGAVPPGQTVDLSVPMTAPASGGSHTGQWQMRDDTSTLFGQVVRVVVSTIVPVPPPQAAVTSPGVNFQFATGTTVHVTFQGAGNTELSSVALYVNGAQVNKATSRTPTRTITGGYDWKPAVGAYTLYAVATDIQGQQTTSGKITGNITQPQPQCQLSVNFRADSYNITVGQSTVLHWDVECANAIYLNGQGVTGHEARSVSPNSTTAYTLRSIKKDGSPDDRTVTITVGGAPPPPPTQAPQPTRRDVNGTWNGSGYTVELSSADGCGTNCGVSGRLIHATSGALEINDVGGSFNSSSGNVSFAAQIPGGQSFSGTVNASSNQMCGNLTGVGNVCFSK